MGLATSKKKKDFKDSRDSLIALQIRFAYEKEYKQTQAVPCMYKL